MKRKFGLVFYLLFFVAGLTYVHYQYEKQWINKNKNQTAVYETLRNFKVPKNETAEMKRSREAELRQVNAKRIMRDYCLTHKFEANPGNLQFIFVDDKFKIMYCAIAKVGSSTWKAVLAKLHNKTFAENSPAIHKWNQWRRLNQYPEKERKLRLQTYFKFLFVREPLHRLLSAFKNKFLPNASFEISKRYRDEIVKLYRPNDFKPGKQNWITFEEFIKYFSSDRYRDHHWLQYEKVCHPCFVNYDFIGRLETLEEDATLLLKLAGLDDRVTFPKIHQQTSHDEVLGYYSQVSPEYIIRIGEQYRSDFLMFGYEYLGPVKPLLNGTWPTNTAKKNDSNELVD